MARDCWSSSVGTGGSVVDVELAAEVLLAACPGMVAGLTSVPGTTSQQIWAGSTLPRSMAADDVCKRFMR